MSADWLYRCISSAVLAMLLLASPAATQAAPPAIAQTDFPTPEVAVAALIEAVGKNDHTGFRALMGPGGERLLESGDKIADANARKDFLASYARHSQIVRQSDTRAVLTIGADDWPLPLPLVQANGRWHFDAKAGAQEIINRRIGRNEIAAIRTSLAFVDAQQVYHERQGAFASHLFSRPGKHDGLYWDAAPGELESPFGPLVAQAVGQGYPGAAQAGKKLPYFGYYFRILRGQGASAPEGAQSYLSGGIMDRGYALLAWPAVYGSTGIVTFEVNQAGVVFQKDLGSNTAKIATGITLFDPDLSWARVDITP